MFNRLSYYTSRLVLSLICSLLLQRAAAQDTTTVVYDTVMQQDSASESYDEDIEEPEQVTERFDSIQGIVSIRERSIPDSAVSALKNDEAFWYVNQKPVKEQPRARFWQQEWFNSLMWLLMIGCFVAILVWFLASSNIILFRRKERPISEEADQPTDGENIFEINFPQEITRAVAAKNYNGAIRLYYLQALKLLSNRDLIHYSQDKTNNEYVSQLYSSSYYKDFFRLTRQFEYAWYGQFPVSETMFRVMEDDFKQFTNRI
jgi:hypothetical protein